MFSHAVSHLYQMQDHGGQRLLACPHILVLVEFLAGSRLMSVIPMHFVALVALALSVTSGAVACDVAAVIDDSTHWAVVRTLV